LCIAAGLPDFSWYKVHTKNGKNIPNHPEISQMAVKYNKSPSHLPTSSIARPSKIYTNGDFWFVNIQSGNPAETNIFPLKDPLNKPKAKFIWVKI
jgi:hypothetical protein